MAKWRVVNTVTELLADKLNQITGTHDGIVTGFLDQFDEKNDLLQMSTLQLRCGVAEYIDASGIWG